MERFDYSVLEVAGKNKAAIVREFFDERTERWLG